MCGSLFVLAVASVLLCCMCCVRLHIGLEMRQTSGAWSLRSPELGGCVGLASSANWVGNFFIAQGSLSLVDYNAGVAFWIFAGFNLFTIAFVWYLMPETKGVELEKIEDFFKGNSAKERA